MLKKHIEDSAANGSRLENLRQVLPSFPETTVRSLLNTLQRRMVSECKMVSEAAVARGRRRMTDVFYRGLSWLVD